MKILDKIIEQGGGLGKTAKSLDVSRQHLSLVRDGEEPVSISLASRIQDVFGVDGYTLLAWQIRMRFEMYRAAKGKKPAKQREEASK